jgi:hypothetical protein
MQHMCAGDREGLRQHYQDTPALGEVSIELRPGWSGALPLPNNGGRQAAANRSCLFMKDFLSRPPGLINRYTSSPSTPGGALADG